MCFALYKVLMFGVMIGLVCGLPVPPKTTDEGGVVGLTLLEAGGVGGTVPAASGDLDTANTFGFGFGLYPAYGGYGGYGGYRSPYYGGGYGRGYGGYGGYGGYYGGGYGGYGGFW